MEDVDKRELKYRYRNYFGVFNRYSVPGFLLLLHGIAIFGLGCFDIGWTVSRYDKSICKPSPGYTCTGNHAYTYAGTSLWGGVLITIDSVLALWVPHCYVPKSCMFQFYVALTFINVLAVTPAVVVINVLELAMNMGVFFDYTPGAGYIVGDTAKFGVVFALTILGSLAFTVTGLNLTIALCCPGPKKLRQDYQRPFAGSMRQSQMNPNMMYGGGVGFAQPPIVASQAYPVGGAMIDPYRYYNAMAGRGYGYGGLGY